MATYVARCPLRRVVLPRRPVEDESALDEWAACHIERVEDIKELFVDRFWFGCEADDPLTSLAFNRAVNPCGAELRVMMGSDIAHWDVPDVSEVLEEAYEMVERTLDRRRCLPCLHLREPGPVLHRDQPGLLHRDRRREGC